MRDGGRVAVVGLMVIAGATVARSDTLSLAAALMPVVASHVPAERPLRPLGQHTAVQDFDFSNGTKVQLTVQRDLSLLASGLVGVAERTGPLDPTRGRAASQSLSLCGLLTLLAAGQLLAAATENTNGEQTATEPDPSFLPFGLRTRSEASEHTRLKVLDAPDARLCTPQPGSRFGYRTTTEVVTYSSGPLRATQTAVQSVAADCRAAPAATPANQLHPALRGDQLAVQCNATHADGTTSRSDYAYLLDSAFYLLLKSTGALGSVNIRYPTLEYSTP